MDYFIKNYFNVKLLVGKFKFVNLLKYYLTKLRFANKVIHKYNLLLNSHFCNYIAEFSKKLTRILISEKHHFGAIIPEEQNAKQEQGKT